MKITLRIVLSLVLAAGAVVAGSTAYQARKERDAAVAELSRRAAVLSETLEDAAGHRGRWDPARLRRLADKYAERGRLVGAAFLDADGKLLAASRTIDDSKDVLREAAVAALERKEDAQLDVPAGERSRLVYARAVEGGVVAVVYDKTFIDEQIAELWRRNYVRLFLHAVLISFVSLWIVRFTIAAPVNQLAEWMKHVRAGDADAAKYAPSDPVFAPLATEASQLARSLAAAREAAEQEAALRQKGASIWTAERLKEHVKSKLGGRALFVVANREPYMHIRRGAKVEVITPASGLVTGVEPILRACGGLWVAHGAGDADRETCDERSKLPVPPGEPQYSLKRVWMTKEQEQGYYYGFANEGLWPLCHIVHARPTFKPADWEHYKQVNRLFADALLEEMEGVEEPCVLMQDYHFALLPEMIKRARPDARVALFWHIPWPNPEAFGICPWQKEIIQGLLGADLLGFHTQFHCNNFLETVDRTLESRIDWDRFSVQRAGHHTLVKPFPISVAFPAEPKERKSKEAVFRQLGLKAEVLALGVDRIDYTKGILERFAGIERFLEKNPDYQGRFTFVQIGAPSRTHIPRYRDFFKQIEAEADRINWRFPKKDYKAILLLPEHHSHEQIEAYYRAADACLVTSLHDGMNLVCKEFVAARGDERGALILSRFAGAARELRDALIVNPYDSEQLADAIKYALTMPEEEQTRRMRAMRQFVLENNVYAWAASLIDELAAVRPVPARAV